MKTMLMRLAALAMAALVSACATPTKMAFQDDAPLKENSTPVLLMTATLKNNYKTGFQPKLNFVNVELAGAKNAAGRLNFTIDDKARLETNALPNGNSYLLRLELKPGTYEIVGLTSMVQSFPIIASFFTPIHATVNVTESGVYYLGHVEASVRERQGTEFKAGPSLPLIDQAVAGASGGTFDVDISDAWAIDEAQFKSKFTVLNNVQVKKAILPPFDRAAAQQWWEAH